MCIVHILEKYYIYHCILYYIILYIWSTICTYQYLLFIHHGCRSCITGVLLHKYSHSSLIHYNLRYYNVCVVYSSLISYLIFSLFHWDHPLYVFLPLSPCCCNINKALSNLIFMLATCFYCYSCSFVCMCKTEQLVSIIR